MLEVEKLVVDHGKLRALWDVSFRVASGSRVGILGANGAGKSTTLGAIMGLYPAAGGRIVYGGTPIGGRAPAANVSAGIALVPEGRRIFPHMSVKENLEIGAYAPAARPMVESGLARVFTLFPILETKLADPAGTLSGGQQQMLAIGRALMSNPKLLLLDEPFLGVAPILVDEVMDALRRIAGQGMTCLLVEQNIHRALDFVEYAYVIENGRTVLEGDKATLLDDPDFSNKFLGLD
jgi:branched-chain amino acid transport system ATP-binding protein